MKTRFLFIFLCIFLLFLININTAKAITSKVFESHIIPVQNKVDISEDYPIVDQIETKVLGQSYQKEDIYKKYKVDSLQFAQSNVYYASDYEEYKNMFEQMTKRLDQKKLAVEALIKAEKKKKKEAKKAKSALNKKTDSLELNRRKKLD